LLEELENCGVFGLWSGKGPVVEQIYYGIFKLQHRGQRYCGIATWDGSIRLITHAGFVRHSFSLQDFHYLTGNLGIAHVSLKELQPMVFHSRLGSYALAFSGNIINRELLRHKLFQAGHAFSTETDTEILGRILSQGKTILDGFQQIYRLVKGSFSLVVLTPRGVYAARDIHGFKPLILGRSGRKLAVSSESRPFDLLGLKIVRDVRPGEIVLLNGDGIKSIWQAAEVRPAFCAFEWGYIASVDSVIDGVPVIRARHNFGIKLARRDEAENLKVDIVSPVPFSGIGCALGYHHYSEVPYQESFLIDRFASRSYTPLVQEEREKEARIKLSVIKDNVRRQRIVLCDDSIVRGTQIRNKVLELKRAGARAVHVRIACPPLIAPCRYSISTRSYEELVALKYSVEGICRLIGADSLKYNTMEDFVEAIGLPPEKLCLSCWTGKYL